MRYEGHLRLACTPVQHTFRVRDWWCAGRASTASGNHNGVDLVCPEGTPIVAPCRARVLDCGFETNPAGNWVRLVAESPTYAWKLYFAHMQRPSSVAGLVPANGWVKAGDIIGYVGHTGGTDVNHTHFQVWEALRSDPNRSFNLINMYYPVLGVSTAAGEDGVSRRPLGPSSPPGLFDTAWAAMLAVRDAHIRGGKRYDVVDPVTGRCGCDHPSCK